MIKIENVQVIGWEPAIRGMRNPKNSWDDSDSLWMCGEDGVMIDGDYGYVIGPKDAHLMQTLADAGSDHGKFLRMIVVYADVVAPLYWWSEYDTYKVGTVANSCSKMHKLMAKPFEMNDFSFDKIQGYKKEVKQIRTVFEEVARPIVDFLNTLRDAWFETDDPEVKKEIWYSTIQALPESYNQRRTVMLNYQVLKNMYHARKNHKLDEWREFCKWIEELPYSQLITGGKK